jgi:hypothetical protein
LVGIVQGGVCAVTLGIRVIDVAIVDINSKIKAKFDTILIFLIIFTLLK